jgi:hypothetical protein
MIDNGKRGQTEIVDAVLDVKHDLGKYIRMPIAMLPVGAPDALVRVALLQALQKTRTGPKGVRSARSIWDAFSAEVAEVLKEKPAFAVLAEAVARALTWEDKATAADPIDRSSVEADFAAVGARIQELLNEVSRA